MKTLEECIEFVKGQVVFHEKKGVHFKHASEKYPAGMKRAESHFLMAAKFSEMLSCLESLASTGLHVPSVTLSKIGLTLEELNGLPPELLEELSISEADKADFEVISVVNEAGGVLSLDKILIALYRKTGEINKRTQINSRIYRMTQKGTMFPVPGKKGVYSTRELTEEESVQIS